MVRRRPILLLILAAALATFWIPLVAAWAEPAAAVVFVCEHGNAKSLIAAELFNREAGRRGSPLRAVARGLKPERGVPAPVEAGMTGDGFSVTGFRATGVTGSESAAARRVVTINLETTKVEELGRHVDSWTDIPAVSVNYAAARDALKLRVIALLDELAPTANQP